MTQKNLPSGNAPSTIDYFVLHGGVRMNALAELYALDLGDLGDATLAEVIHRLRQEPASGDRVALGPVELVVVNAEGGEVRTAGLRFSGSQAARPSRRHVLRARHATPSASYRVGRHRVAFPWPPRDGGPRRSAGA